MIRLMKKIPLKIVNKTQRSCDGCTACCEGWLTANIKGHEMYPGKPCPFVKQGVGCSIYKDRPKNPCKGFECMWKATDSTIMPDRFKPSEIGAIVTIDEIDGIPYHRVTECGVKLDSDFLSWFVLFAMENRLNAFWTVDGVPNWFGAPDFSMAMFKFHSELNSAE